THRCCEDHRKSSAEMGIRRTNNEIIQQLRPAHPWPPATSTSTAGLAELQPDQKRTVSKSAKGDIDLLIDRVRCTRKTSRWLDYRS
ncbi:MAG: hypothetical protein Q8K12_01255, partial [Thiobacillus sp.]|nr:hypothetical protein [Thiobacillus sp.]